MRDVSCAASVDPRAEVASSPYGEGKTLHEGYSRTRANDNKVIEAVKDPLNGDTTNALARNPNDVPPSVSSVVRERFNDSIVGRILNSVGDS